MQKAGGICLLNRWFQGICCLLENVLLLHAQKWKSIYFTRGHPLTNASPYTLEWSYSRSVFHCILHAFMNEIRRAHIQSDSSDSTIFFHSINKYFVSIKMVFEYIPVFTQNISTQFTLASIIPLRFVWLCFSELSWIQNFINQLNWESVWRASSIIAFNGSHT